MSDHPWTIRLATRGDLGALMAIEHAQFPEPWSRKMMLEELENVETRRYSVAEESGTVIGYLGVMFILDEMHVNSLGTTPGHEGRGVAGSLLEDVMAVAKARRIARASLEVAASNTRAQALYRRFGFAPVGIRKNYYQRIGEDALVLWAEFASDEVTP